MTPVKHKLPSLINIQQTLNKNAASVIDYSYNHKNHNSNIKKTETTMNKLSIVLPT